MRTGKYVWRLQVYPVQYSTAASVKHPVFLTGGSFQASTYGVPVRISVYRTVSTSRVHLYSRRTVLYRAVLLL